ncbi:TetR/AcrR family transcriptional regulator [Nakamurella lactea]|uniref:TetR/AcrR family transcriptional regulator n=1 Tax=Nakamurella lactea TaxID=459515 RepID=UPI001B7FB882|nr:TetR/AcrR family transcriptional regulator [Nakamurella lactea]
MTPVVTKVERVAGPVGVRFAERRDELARSALQTLSELGYARTSLREIAQNSDFSHGVLHYYFADKVDLITHCVRLYKNRCVLRYDHITDQATTAGEVLDLFVEALTLTLREDALIQRLWYDLRLQSLFEPSFRSDVSLIDRSLRDMVWRVLSRYAELSGDVPAVSGDTAYAIFDGIFSHLIMRQLSGGEDLERLLSRRVRLMFPRLLKGGEA